MLSRDDGGEPVRFHQLDAGTARKLVPKGMIGRSEKSNSSL
jgi:hypothetical protein